MLELLLGSHELLHGTTISRARLRQQHFCLKLFISGILGSVDIVAEILINLVVDIGYGGGSGSGGGGAKGKATKGGL